MAQALAADPAGSLARRCGTWAATLGAYRLLNNARVEPAALISGHVRQTRLACADEPVVLCVQDSTELEAVRELSATKLVQHSALAVKVDGQVLGLLAARWEDDPRQVVGESSDGNGRGVRCAGWRRRRRWARRPTVAG